MEVLVRATVSSILSEWQNQTSFRPLIQQEIGSVLLGLRRCIIS